MTAAAAQHAAQTILSESRFRAPNVPRPLHGFLAAVGRLLTDPLRLLERLVRTIGGWFPGGVAGVWVLLGLGLVLGTLVVASRHARRRLARPAGQTGAADPESAAALDRLAAAAERDRRWREAVRLRFRAGVARLSEREEFSAARSMTSGQIARILRSDSFISLARRFEEIVYGEATATADDAEMQRRDWPRILRATASR
jgi:hypothetical protein